MAIGSTILLAATTSATQSTSFSLTQASKGQQVTVQVIGLTSTNKAYLQVENIISPGNFVNVLLNGNPIYCDVSNNLIYISSNGRYRIDKQGSDNVGVAIVSDKSYDII